MEYSALWHIVKETRTEQTSWQCNQGHEAAKPLELLDLFIKIPSVHARHLYGRDLSGSHARKIPEIQIISD